jgi:transcription initiation factor TFIID TATA-box-binding protein
MSNDYTVVNMVATAKLGEFFDLIDISDDLDIYYAPEQFPGMSIKITNPKVCVNLFRSGQAVATGAKTLDDVNSAFEQVRSMLEGGGYEPFSEITPSLSNVVITHNMEQELNLANLTISLPMARTEWEPEQFPGLIFRLEDLPSVCLIFSSGKCVITGSNSLEEAEQAVEALREELLAVL